MIELFYSLPSPSSYANFLESQIECTFVAISELMKISSDSDFDFPERVNNDGSGRYYGLMPSVLKNTSIRGSIELNILLFHGVTNSTANSNKTSILQNYNNKHISDTRFEEILNYLDSSPYPVLSMNDIVLINQGHLKPPEYAYAISFDDGFSNNFDVAAPLLSKYHLPAIFYLSTSLIDSSIRLTLS